MNSKLVPSQYYGALLHSMHHDSSQSYRRSVLQDDMLSLNEDDTGSIMVTSAFYMNCKGDWLTGEYNDKIWPTLNSSLVPKELTAEYNMLSVHI